MIACVCFGSFAMSERQQSLSESFDKFGCDSANEPKEQPKEQLNEQLNENSQKDDSDFRLQRFKTGDHSKSHRISSLSWLSLFRIAFVVCEV